MKTAFNKLLIEKYQKINNNQLEMFYKYMQLLLKWNEKINLTAITDENEIILKHFVDSLTVLKYIKENDKIIDVGTGAGFPGIPIAIMMPNVKITLLDSLNKRINFLNEVIKELGLKNVETIHSRSEDCGKDMLYREKYDVSIARAVANLSTLSEYLLPFVKIGGKMICMKGSEIEEELKNAQYAIKVLGGKIISRDEFTLPDSDIKRNIIIVEKEQYTPKMYPRKAGLPAKEPIIIK
ncbi:MAG TPA: 16S rRNA (guanine(527)-N(7))-methyltransferase RsmG [Clostridiales bacterium]|nr:16S rRNA (guanine(527)-N(7))-methyltransferase RsmG [Clostridiales bacterium]